MVFTLPADDRHHPRPNPPAATAAAAAIAAAIVRTTFPPPHDVHLGARRQRGVMGVTPIPIAAAPTAPDAAAAAAAAAAARKGAGVFFVALVRQEGEKHGDGCDEVLDGEGC